MLLEILNGLQINKKISISIFKKLGILEKLSDVCQLRHLDLPFPQKVKNPIESNKTGNNSMKSLMWLWISW